MTTATSSSSDASAADPGLDVPSSCEWRPGDVWSSADVSLYWPRDPRARSETVSRRASPSWPRSHFEGPPEASIRANADNACHTASGSRDLSGPDAVRTGRMLLAGLVANVIHGGLTGAMLSRGNNRRVGVDHGAPSTAWESANVDEPRGILSGIASSSMATCDGIHAGRGIPCQHGGDGPAGHRWRARARHRLRSEHQRGGTSVRSPL